jgi:hypothetical protein
MDGRFTAMLVLAGTMLAHGAALAATLPQPIATNKTRFRIPFKIDPAALQRMNARELQLHVSTDRGATWKLAQTLTPDGGKFEYQAPGDGEYWFAVKTLDGRNQLHPPVGSYETGLIVVVDSVAPLLELTLQQLAPGKVQLSWNAADANLNPSTLKIEYTQPGSDKWEQVEVTPRSSGQIAWNIDKPGQVSVRGTISDTASNDGTAKAQLQIVAVGDPAPKPKSNRRVPIAELDDGSEQASNDLPSLTPQPGARPIPPLVPTTPIAPLTTSKNPSIGIPAAPASQSEYRGPVITPFGGGNSGSTYNDQLVSSSPATRPEITQDRWSGNSGNPEPTTMATTMPPNPGPRPPSNRRMVNSRKFQVGYAVDDVGPSGIGAVELFITEDNGRKWWKYGDDPDRRSPFDVVVPRDGEYGFAIRVRSGVGLTNDPPLPGELPAIIVGVDQTPPKVEILSAQQGQGANSNRVQVRWRVTDDHPAAQPVALYFAAKREGPWEALSGWKDDTGSFDWAVQPGSPAQMYIRVVARDAAGNLGNAELAQPILIDLARPTARIVDVENPQATPQQ